MVNAVSDLMDGDSALEGSVILDFYADWCVPCQAVKPIFEKLSMEHKQVRFFKVDVDANQAVADMFVVRSIPTILFLKEGMEIDRAVGTMQESSIRAKVSKLLGQ